MFRSIPQLEAFYWVARLGSFRAAAERLGMTQPSISVRIKDLEAEADGALFSRSTRGVRMTDKGRAMFDHVERIMTLLGDLDGHVRGAGPLRGLLRLGVPDSYALCCLPAFMAQLERRYPELNVAITVDNSRVLNQKLDENLLDLAILAQPEAMRSIRLNLLGRQKLSWVAAPSVELPDRVLAPTDIKQLPILTNPSPSPTFSILMDWFATHGLVPLKVNTCSALSAITNVVVSAGGIGVLPTCVAAADLSRGRLIELKVQPELPLQDIYIAYPRAIPVRSIPYVLDIVQESMVGTGFIVEETE